MQRNQSMTEKLRFDSLIVKNTYFIHEGENHEKTISGASAHPTFTDGHLK